MSPARLLLPTDYYEKGTSLGCLSWEQHKIIRCERQQGGQQPFVHGDGCLFFFLQAAQSLRKAISSSSQSDVPAEVKEGFGGPECCRAADCPNSLRLQQRFGEHFFPLFPLPVQAHRNITPLPSLEGNLLRTRGLGFPFHLGEQLPPAPNETLQGFCRAAPCSRSATSRRAAQPLKGSAGQITISTIFC